LNWNWKFSTLFSFFSSSYFSSHLGLTRFDLILSANFITAIKIFERQNSTAKQRLMKVIASAYYSL